MDCNSFHELINAYYDGELSENKINELTVHLSECSACSTLFRQQKETIELLGDINGETPDFVTGAMQRIHLLHKNEQKKRIRKSIRIVSSIAAAIAVITISTIIIGSGIINSSNASTDSAAYSASDMISGSEHSVAAEEAETESAEKFTDFEYEEPCDDIIFPELTGVIHKITVSDTDPYDFEIYIKSCVEYESSIFDYSRYDIDNNLWIIVTQSNAESIMQVLSPYVFITKLNVGDEVCIIFE